MEVKTYTHWIEYVTKTKDIIDLSNYSKVVFEFEYINGIDVDEYLTVGYGIFDEDIVWNQNSSNYYDKHHKRSQETSSNEPITLEYDISEYQNGYVGFTVNNGASAKVTAVYLVPDFTPVIEETSNGIKMTIQTLNETSEYIMNKVHGEDDCTLSKQDDCININFGTAYIENPKMCNFNEIDWSKYSTMEVEIEITGDSNNIYRNIEIVAANSDFTYIDYNYFIKNDNIANGENQYLNKRVTATLDLTQYADKNVKYIGFSGNNYNIKVYRIRLY